MKLKHISALLLCLFAFSFAGISQVEDGEVRSLGGNMHDFKTFKDAPVSFEIKITNSEQKSIMIGKILIPEGVSVGVTKEIIKPGHTGALIVTVHPKHMEEGTFNKQLVYSLISKDVKGNKITKTIKYKLKGEKL